MNRSITTAPSLSMIWLLAISINMALPPRLNILGEVITIISPFFILDVISDHAGYIPYKKPCEQTDKE